jgi:hypothetical protein
MRQPYEFQAGPPFGPQWQVMQADPVPETTWSTVVESGYMPTQVVTKLP